MEKLGHNDERQVKSLKDFLLPGWNEVLLFFVISLVIILFINASVIWEVLNEYSGINVVESSGAIRTQFDSFYEEYFASKFLARVAVFVFWGMVGSVTYMLVWAIWHFYLRIKEDIDESEYENNKKSSGFWQSRISQHLLVFFSTTAGILYLLVAFYLYPTIFALSKLTLYHLGDLLYYQYIITAVLISMIYLYIFTRLWRAIKYVDELYFVGLDE
jgi:hypothetical protein